MGQKLGGCAPLGEVELGPHLTQCGQGRGLSARQVSSWSIQPFAACTIHQRYRETGQDINNGLIAYREPFCKRSPKNSYVSHISYTDLGLGLYLQFRPHRPSYFTSWFIQNLSAVHRPHCVRWRPSSPSSQRGTAPPNFRPMSTVEKRLDASGYPLATEVDLGSGHIALDGDPASSPERSTAAPLFLAHAYFGQTVAHLSYCWALVTTFMSRCDWSMMYVFSLQMCVCFANRVRYWLHGTWGYLLLLLMTMLIIMKVDNYW